MKRATLTNTAELRGPRPRFSRASIVVRISIRGVGTGITVTFQHASLSLTSDMLPFVSKRASGTAVLNQAHGIGGRGLTSRAKT